MGIDDLIGSDNLIWKLFIALLLGAIVGTQRGWAMRNSLDGSRIAGIRTFSLVGLLGGLVAALAKQSSVILIGFALVVLVVVAAIAFVIQQQRQQDISITGVVALMITFLLGCLVIYDQAISAAAAAVITAIVLDNKKELHQAITKLKEYELDAALQLLLISIVMLPLLPNRGFGPWDAINPYEIWWMVVLIASISFVGYFAIRIAGAKRGILFTSIFAGLSSSTALTLQFSQLSKQQPTISPLLATGILMSCGTMFPRLLIVLSVINPAIVPLIIWPIGVMMLTMYLPCWWLWRKGESGVVNQTENKKSPLALGPAVFFGLVLALIMLLSQALGQWFGDVGVLLLAAVSGMTDVDAISLALARQSITSLPVSVAAIGIVIAASVNTLVKMLMVVFFGERTLWMMIVPVMTITVISGFVFLYWLGNVLQ